MTSASELRSGKTHRDENFPVASWIIHPRHRALILAFYNFVRTADDIADHATLGERQKLDYLDLLEAELLGRGDSQPEAVNLRRALGQRSMRPRHALDVLTAFRMDVTKLRYENWDEVIHYCRYSAMPVGRFVLDVHGESMSTWAASDALCAALQINNHLQDCGKDYRALNRVYLPLDALTAARASVEALAEGRASAALLQCLHSLAARRILTREQRYAMFQIYNFCRQVDDIADSDGPRTERLAALQQWRDDIDALYQDRPPARLQDYVASIRRFDLQREDFLAVVDGMEMDVPQDIRAPDLATLDLYCDRVASAVGRLSVRVFGLARDDGILLAHHLGRALQLTNILRDVDEDAAIGRLYVPREALLHAGITDFDPLKVIADPALPKACAPLVERARIHFQKADEVMDRNPRRVVRAPRIMSKYYRAILELLVGRGFAPPRTAVRLNKMARIAIVLRYAFI